MSDPQHLDAPRLWAVMERYVTGGHGVHGPFSTEQEARYFCEQNQQHDGQGQVRFTFMNIQPVSPVADTGGASAAPDPTWVHSRDGSPCVSYSGSEAPGSWWCPHAQYVWLAKARQTNDSAESGTSGGAT